MPHPLHVLLEGAQVEVLRERPHLADERHRVQRLPGDQHRAFLASQSVKSNDKKYVISQIKINYFRKIFLIFGKVAFGD